MKFGLKSYTLDCFLDQVINRYATRPALALVGQEPITYAQLGLRVSQARERLRQLGIQKSDRVALLGRGTPDWASAFLAITTMGAVAVPILEDFPEADIDHVIAHSESKAVIIDPDLFEGLHLPVLDHGKIVLSMGDLSSLKPGAEEHLWDQVTEIPDRLRRTVEHSLPRPHPRQPDKIVEDDLAEIIYTSGTTGHSRGVMLTHGNLVSNLFEGPDMLGVIDSESVILSFLPLAHTFGSTSGFLSIIYRGACIYFLGKKPVPKILIEAMGRVRPTIIGSVPLIFEKIYHKQVQPAIQSSAVLRTLSRGKRGRKLVHRLVGRKIMKRFGGRLKCAIIGGASLSEDVEIFLREGGIPYALGYGLTECSPLVTFSAVSEAPIGSVGRPITDVQVRIADSDPTTGIGEILIKGPNVMVGYLKNEAETQRAFTKDGWFKTGDRGILDRDGYLFITGRSKNVIIGPSGENIHPEAVEDKLNNIAGVEESIVFESEGKLVARVLPDYEYLRRKAGEQPITEESIATFLKGVRNQANARLAPGARLSQVIEQTEPFAKTATNKIKRYLYIESDRP